MGDVATLQSMFPTLDADLIQAVYDASNASFDETLNKLLEIVDPSQAAVVQKEEQLRSTSPHQKTSSPPSKEQQRHSASPGSLLIPTDPLQAVSSRNAREGGASPSSKHTLTERGGGAGAAASPSTKKEEEEEAIDPRAFLTEEERLQDDADAALARQLAQTEEDEAYALALHQQEIERAQREQAAHADAVARQRRAAQGDDVDDEPDFIDEVEKKFVAFKGAASKKFKDLFSKLNIDSPPADKSNEQYRIDNGGTFRNLLDDEHDDTADAELLPSPVIAKQTRLPSPIPPLPSSSEPHASASPSLQATSTTSPKKDKGASPPKSPFKETKDESKGKSPAKAAPTLQVSSTDVLAKLSLEDEEANRAFFGIESSQEAGPPPAL